MNKSISRFLLILTTIAFGIGGALGVILAAFSVMIFDAPGSQNQPLNWLVFAVLASFPFVCFGSIALGWINFRAGKFRLASLVSLAPLVSIAILAALGLFSNG